MCNRTKAYCMSGDGLLLAFGLLVNGCTGSKHKRAGRISLCRHRSMGSLVGIANPDAGDAQILSPAYRMSKTLLNAITLLLAKELRGTNILINSACPGWVRTGMGGDRAPLSPEQGASTPVWLATLPDDGPSGGFFRDRQPVPW